MALSKFEIDLQSGHGCKKKGHFKCYMDNVYQGDMPAHFQQMFLNGSGNELKKHATAIHSSSMLAYNFFHWICPSHPFKYNDIKYTEVYFETKLLTLKSSKRAPAHIDIVLLGEKDKETHILFIESKFTEFFSNKKFELSSSYDNKDKYFNNEANENIVNFVKKVRNSNIQGYGEGIKQGITHVVGITNLYNSDAFEYFKQQILHYKFDSILGKFKSVNDLIIHFENVIFNPANETNAFINYQDQYNDIIINNFNYDLFNIGLLTYSKLWDNMKNQIDEGLHEFLWQRYMRFAEGATK